MGKSIVKATWESVVTNQRKTGNQGMTGLMEEIPGNYPEAVTGEAKYQEEKIGVFVCQISVAE